LVSARHSLQTKLTASFVILILLISGLTFFYTYGATKSALKDTIQDELAQVAGVMATQVNGDSVILLKPGEENTTGFIAIRDQLVGMRANSKEITNAYIMKNSGNGIVFVVDDIYGTDPDAALIGESYTTGETSTIFEAMKSPVASKDFYTDKWGTFMSGYAPIRNSAGETVAVLGVDMTADKVIAKQDFIGYTIYLIMGLSALIAGLIIFYFSRTMIRDIRKLNDTAEKISMGDMSAMVEVQRNDEIGELASSFSRMVASLKIMMSDDDDKP